MDLAGFYSVSLPLMVEPSSAEYGIRRMLERRMRAWLALAEGLRDMCYGRSAAFRNLDREAQEDLTQRYQDLMRHYDMMLRL